MIIMVAYIIDTYNKYQDNADVIANFKLRDQPYCVRRIELNYNWGTPLPDWAEKEWRRDYQEQHYYETAEEALEYVRTLKKLYV